MKTHSAPQLVTLTVAALTGTLAAHPGHPGHDHIIEAANASPLATGVFVLLVIASLMMLVNLFRTTSRRPQFIFGSASTAVAAIAIGILCRLF